MVWVLGGSQSPLYMYDFSNNFVSLIIVKSIRNVARCWTYETAVALGVEIANELPYNDYFEYFGPDFKLHISPSNMSNQNTGEYMDKIR